MQTTSVCRICRVADIYMHNIKEDQRMQEIYGKLTRITVTKKDKIPFTICYICYSLLKKYHKFLVTALHSDEILRNQHNNMIERSSQPSPIINLKIKPSNFLTINKFTTEEDNNTNFTITEEPIITVKVEVNQDEEFEANNKTIKVEPFETGKSTAKSNVFNCKICNKSYFRKDYLTAHIHVHGHNHGIPFTCSKCKKKFFVLHKWMKHVKTCNGVKPAFPCSMCNLYYPSVALVMDHMKMHDDKTCFHCDRCKKVFPNRGDFVQHMKTHGENKPFVCEVCGKRFNQHQNLRLHMMTHTGEKNFICKVCSRAFITKGNLVSHMRRHTKEKPFQCTVCGTLFGYRSSLKYHVKHQHQKIKPFPCTICSWSFNREESLNAHTKTHTRERPFECNVCEKRFNSMNNLKEHMKAHSDEKPVECRNCGEKFKKHNNMRQHMKTRKCRSNVERQMDAV